MDIVSGGGNVNDEIPIEVLFKYLHRDFKNEGNAKPGERERWNNWRIWTRSWSKNYNKLYEEKKKLEDEVFKKDVEHQKEMEETIRNDSSAFQWTRQIEGAADRSNPINRIYQRSFYENKQMKAFLRSIMNTCDTVRELEIA